MSVIDICTLDSLPVRGGGCITIPAMEDGLLPLGVHDCTLDEICEIFVFNPWRNDLFTFLSAYVGKLHECGVSGWIVVDGSYVQMKDEPSDIDLLIVIDRKKSTYKSNERNLQIVLDLLRMDEAKDRFKLHIFTGYADDVSGQEFVNLSPWLKDYIQIFTLVRDRPFDLKGMLRLAI